MTKEKLLHTQLSNSDNVPLRYRFHLNQTDIKLICVEEKDNRKFCKTLWRP